MSLPADARAVLVGPAVEQVAQAGVELRLGQLARCDRVLAEAERVVEVLGRGEQVRRHPHAVAGLGALAGAERAPQRRGVAQPARPQLEADERGEGLLGRAAGRTPTPAPSWPGGTRRARVTPSCGTASSRSSTSSRAR